MKINRVNGLQLAEYLALLLSLVGLIIFIFRQQILWFLVFIFLTLLLNSINSIIYRSKSNKKLSSVLRKLSQELNSEKNQDSKIHVNRENYLEHITMIQQAIDKIVIYLEQNQFQERIARLENLSQVKQPLVKQPPVKQPLVKMTSIPEKKTNLSMSWKLLKTIPAHEEAVTDLAIGDRQEFLASVSWDKYLKLWNLKSGELIDSIEAHNQGILAVSCRDKQIATGGFDQDIKLWSVIEREHLEIRSDRTMTGHSGSIHGLAIAPESKILASVSYDQTLKQWDLETGDKISSSLDELGAIYALTLHENSQIIASGGGDGTVSLWRLETGELISTLIGNVSSVQSVGVSHDGQILAAGCTDGSIKIWNLTSLGSEEMLQPIHTIKAHEGQVMSLIFHPQGLLFSGGAEGEIKVWHNNSDQPLEVFPNQQERVLSLALNQVGDLLVSGTLDGVIKVWSVQITS